VRLWESEHRRALPALLGLLHELRSPFLVLGLPILSDSDDLDLHRSRSSSLLMLHFVQRAQLLGIRNRKGRNRSRSPDILVLPNSPLHLCKGRIDPEGSDSRALVLILPPSSTQQCFQR
jgi:hypothetical protein